eukprot:450682_1
MSNINWYLDVITLRKQLLLLPKPKLIKLCKSKKLSTNGTKGDLVQRLLSKKKKQKQQSTQKQQITHKPLPSISDLSKKLKDFEDYRKEWCDEWDFEEEGYEPIVIDNGSDSIKAEWCDEWDFEEEGYEPIVIDNGSDSIKAGWSGDDQPRVTFPTIVGQHYRYHGVMVGMHIKDWYVGDECIAKRGLLQTRNPIGHDGFCNMDYMEHVWHHTFYNELRIQPEESVVLLTEPCCSPARVREKMVQAMFETFNVPAVYLASQSALSLYAVGKMNGIVLQSGGSVTRSVPIYEGYCLKHAVRTLRCGGRGVDDYFNKLLLNNRGYSFVTDGEREIVRDMKEKLCFVALDGGDHKEEETEYELPDGRTITIGEEKHKALEILFTPNIVDSLTDEVGIQ